MGRALAGEAALREGRLVKWPTDRPVSPGQLRERARFFVNNGTRQPRRSIAGGRRVCDATRVRHRAIQEERVHRIARIVVVRNVAA